MKEQPKKSPSRLGNLLRKARENAGLSQAALARLAGTVSTTIHRIENGDRSGEFTTMCRIADALDLSLDALAIEARLRKPKAR